MDGLRGECVWPPHDTASAKKKSKLRFFKSSEHINEKGDGPYHGFGFFIRQKPIKSNISTTSIQQQNNFW